MSYAPPPSDAAPGASPLPPAHQLRGWQRVMLAAAGAVLVVLLGTAASLTPSSRGYGTHQGLGLPPCTIVQWYGVRCPSCGMTTSWAHMTRGQAWRSVQANAGGALLALVAATCGPWMLASGLAGRWLLGPPRESVTLAVGLVVVLTTLIDWCVRLYWGG